MPYKIKAMNQACKKRRYERNKTFRRRVKRLVFRLRGCAGTLTGKCTWQGDISHVALQFDHRDGEEKKHNICRMDGHSIENIKKEMRKCDVVCANCHAIRTEQRRLRDMEDYDHDLDKSVLKINHEEDIKQNYVRKDVYEMLFDKCERLEERLADVHEKLSSQERGRVMRIKDLNKQNHALQELNIQMNERNQDLHKRLEEKSYREVTAPRYMFSEIPRNMYGDAFVDALKKYLNRSRYTMKVRGQHIKEELKGRGLTEHGQNIEQSTHLRVYIEEKD